MYNSPYAVLKGIRAEFAKSLKQMGTSSVDGLCNSFNSDVDTEDYVFFDSLPGIKEFKSKIDEGSFKTYKMSLQNIPWQWSVPVDRYTLSDSKKSLGPNLENYIKSGVQAWKTFPDKLISTLLSDNGTAWDGTALFATSRPNLDGATVDNLYSGTGTTSAQIQTDFAGAVAYLLKMTDKNGEPFNLPGKWLVYIPSQLWFTFTQIQQSAVLSGSVTNVLQNNFDIAVNPYQSTSDNDWYLVNPNSPIKPFVFQTREMPEFSMKDQTWERNILYYATSRSAAGIANPMAIVKVNNS